MAQKVQENSAVTSPEQCPKVMTQQHFMTSQQSQTPQNQILNESIARQQALREGARAPGSSPSAAAEPPVAVPASLLPCCHMPEQSAAPCGGGQEVVYTRLVSIHTIFPALAI